MSKYLGIDLGTSSVKIIVMDNDGTIVDSYSKEYPLYNLKENYSEQNPIDWLEAIYEGIKEITLKKGHRIINGISFSGQMHGLVILDSNDCVIRPCILWNDGRSTQEVDYLNNQIGLETLCEETGNKAYPGFTLPKLLWVMNNEPDNYKRIKKIMLPKDYISYILTGVFCTDFSDASGTLLLDVKNKKWSKKMMSIAQIDESMLPSLFESYEIVGEVKQDLVEKLGFLNTPKVVIGAADNAAAAIGTGCINDSSCNISIGTSGTLFISSNLFVEDSSTSLHSFCHANGYYYAMGCILSAGNSRKWWKETILDNKDYNNSEIQLTKIKENKILFLPYLSGERCPYNDVSARGVFVGLTSMTSKYEIEMAILEGVAFAIKDCLVLANKCGLFPSKVTLCGGGAKSDVWINIFANILNLPVYVLENEQGPAMGACMLAMVGCKEYSSIKEVCEKFLKVKKTYYPNDELCESYNKKYELYKMLYPTLKNTMKSLGEL